LRIARVGLWHMCEYIIVNKHTVLILLGCFAEIAQCFVFTIGGRLTEGSLSSEGWRIPLERIRRIGVWMEAVVVGARIIGIGRYRKHRIEGARREDQIVPEMLIGRGPGAALADDGVVVGQDAGRTFDVLERSGRRVVDDVLIKINRPPEHRLDAE